MGLVSDEHYHMRPCSLAQAYRHYSSSATIGLPQFLPRPVRDLALNMQAAVSYVRLLL
jgi:hypothetical protein